MNRAFRLGPLLRVATATALSLPAAAWPHAFDERYDLPAPLTYFVAGATAAVGLSFVVAALFARRAPPVAPAADRVVTLGYLLPVLRPLCGFAALALFAITIVAGLFGTRDPLMNFAPTLVWIVWWVGLSLLVACIGNVWPALDPWRTLFGMLDALARRLGRQQGVAIGWTYPHALGAWPAVVCLLLLSWFEVVYAQGSAPDRIARVAVAWSVVTLAGMVCFGRESWQRNADLFAVYFATLGRFAPVAAGPDARTICLRSPGHGLVTADAGSFAMVGFVIAMLSTVLFDGLLSGEAWWVVQHRITRAVPQLFDGNGYIVGTIGLIGVWLVFLASYWASCRIAVLLAGTRATWTMMRAFAFCLVPIAIAYNIAHNCANFLVQGQQIIPLLSDPLGLQWNLLGTAAFRPEIGLIDAQVTWYIAIGAIVAGHVISIWLAHRVALREFATARRAVIATIPLTVLMLIYTAISLSIIAEPMVRFSAELPQAWEAGSPLHPKT